MGRGSFLYIFKKSFLASFLSLPFQILEKCHSTIQSFLKGLISLYFLNSFFFFLSSFIALPIHTFRRGRMLHVKLFLCHPSLLCHSVVQENTLSHSLVLEGIDFMFSRISSLILHASPIPYFRKMLFHHPILSEGIEFSVSFHSLFCHPSLLYQSILWGGGGYCMSFSSFIVLPCSIIPYY